MKKKYPLISIVIPVYNGSNYLGEAIESALAQFYKNYEIIVVNDGSTDNGETERIAKKYLTEIRYFYKNNGGVADALNYGIQHMKGEYFSWLSHDDRYYPNKLRFEVEELNNTTKDEIIYGMWDCIDSNSKFLGFGGGFNTKRGDFRVSLIDSYPIHGCATLIPKSAFVKVGLFRTDLKSTNDYEMWFRLSSNFDFRFISKTLSSIRIHNHQGSMTMRYHLREVDNLGSHFLSNISKEELISAHPEISLNKIYWKIAKHYISWQCRKTSSELKELEINLSNNSKLDLFFNKTRINLRYFLYDNLMLILRFLRKRLSFLRESSFRFYLFKSRNK